MGRRRPPGREAPTDRPDQTGSRRELLEARLGYAFRDGALLDRAMTHASFANEAGLPEGSDYDRLEFLGDAVIGLILADHELRARAEAPSGDLSRGRAHFARRQALADAGRKLGLGTMARLSSGERTQGGTARRRLLADLYEALVGAIYQDGGLEEARRVVLETLVTPSRGPGPVLEDSKSALQEHLQGRGLPAPSYSVIESGGPSHDPIFVIEVAIDGRAAGQGIGGSKREAEQAAARVALEALARRART